MEHLCHQAAGHDSIFVGTEAGVVYKQANDGENEFYNEISSDAQWQRFVPRYYGVGTASALDASASSGKSRILKLQDLTYGFQRPCVMDIKIGLSTVAEDATEPKRRIAHEKDLNTTTHWLALRICGLQVFDGTAYQSRDKEWGKSLDSNAFRDGLRLFFNPTNAPTLNESARRRLTSCLTQVDEILQFMRVQRKYRLYASSLLFVYEGASPTETAVEAHPVVRMIDMAHVFPLRADDGVGDNGYCVGLENLVAALKAIVDA
jgi:hypothetical protein